MKVMDMILTVLLGLCVVLQFNDPDPFYWVVAYGLAAVVPLLNLLGRRPQYFAGISFGLIVSGLIYSAPGFVEYLRSGDFGSLTGPMDVPATYVEPAREFLGLLIAFAAVSGYLYNWCRRV